LSWIICLMLTRKFTVASSRACSGRDALNISQIWFYKNSLLSSLCEIARFSIRHLFPALFNENFLFLFILVSRFDIRFHSKKGMIGSLRGWQAVSVGILCRLKFKMMKDTRRNVGINWILRDSCVTSRWLERKDDVKGWKHD